MDATPLHQNSGGQSAAVSTTPIVVSLAGTDATADGSTLVVCFLGAVTQQVNAAPSGWVKFGPASATNVKPTWFRRGPAEGLVAGETSWSFNPASATVNPLEWVVLEYPNVDPDAPLDVLPASLTSTSSGTTSTNTTGLTSSYDALALSFHGSYMSTGGTADSWGSHTGGFTELAEQSVTDGTKSLDLSVSALAVVALGTYGATATCSRTLDATNAGFSLTFVITSATARKAADLLILDGAEQGTVAGATLGGTAQTRLLDTITGSVTADAAAARSGNFGWLLTGTAAAANFTLVSTGALPALSNQLGQRSVFGRHFRFPTLPGADLEIWALVDANGPATTYTLRFIAATGKLGLRIGSGTEQVSDQAVTANQWFRVDLRLDMRSTAVTADWQVTYDATPSVAAAPVAQTQATGTALAGTTLVTYRVGWTTASTATLHSDDAAGSGVPGNYPLGDLRVLPCKVDPAGTPSINGTTANFGVMTANGTIGAWNAANALAAVDDIPPVLGASADGVAMVTASATDYVEFPMETYDAAANGAAIRGVRAIFALGAASTLVATIRLLAYDGTTTYSLFAEADPNADNTAIPVWVAKVIRGSIRTDWTQAKLDALVLRAGSNDATPDIWVHALLLEVAVVKAPTQLVSGEPGAIETVATVDPDSAAKIELSTTTPVDKGATLRWEESGTPGTPLPVAAGSTGTHTFPSATDVTTVNRVEVESDPEAADRP